MSALTAADIVIRPVISEKSIDVSTLNDRNASAGNKYTFAVHRDAMADTIAQRFPGEASGCHNKGGLRHGRTASA